MNLWFSEIKITVCDKKYQKKKSTPEVELYLTPKLHWQLPVFPPEGLTLQVNYCWQLNTQVMHYAVSKQLWLSLLNHVIETRLIKGLSDTTLIFDMWLVHIRIMKWNVIYFPSEFSWSILLSDKPVSLWSIGHPGFVTWCTNSCYSLHTVWMQLFTVVARGMTMFPLRMWPFVVFQLSDYS